MLKWFHCEGWHAGPHPEETIEALREASLAKNPHAVIRVEPAWEAPFEKMPTAVVNAFNYSAPAGRERMFLFRADKDFYWFVINLRCALKIRRKDGREPYKPLSHPRHLTKAAQEELELAIMQLSKGKGTWDCGWSPACP